MSRCLQAFDAAVMLGPALSAPSIAAAQGRSETAPNCGKGNDTAYFSPGNKHRDPHASNSLNKLVLSGKCPLVP
jgi:hypothetical protein